MGKVTAHGDIVAWTFGPGRTCKGPGPGSDPVPNRKWAIFVWEPSNRVGPAKVRDRGRTRFQIRNEEVRATMHGEGGVNT